jgi:cyclic pyranopterin phosphate synthase
MRDNHHRVINYLRLSVTDRCNLRCVYCMPAERVQVMPHGQILSYEEMLHFVERLCMIESLDEITLTTNGVFLKDFVCALREFGICRINVSIDTLKKEG